MTEFVYKAQLHREIHTLKFTTESLETFRQAQDSHEQSAEESEVVTSAGVTAGEVTSVECSEEAKEN